MDSNTSLSEGGEVDAVIIGAGFSGLYQLHCLRDKLGLSCVVLEAANGIGGTWYHNRYPGARCDSESHSYSYYFSDEILREWDWTERYPQQQEIMAYLNFVAKKLDLMKDIVLGARVSTAHFEENDNIWRITTSKGFKYKANFLITAVGCLSSANMPNIRGLKNFSGELYHTGNWPHEMVDFHGKRVGIIGTGSTGIQAIPVIAETAAHLTVFQRTPNYSIPAHNRPLSDEFKTFTKNNIKELRKLMHSSTNGHPFLISDESALNVSENEREKLYEEAWKVGGLRFRGVFSDILINKDSNDTAANFIKDKIFKIVDDQKIAKKLSNIDHPFATKRPPIDTNYFETYNRDNVDLVDVRADPISCITPAGLETKSLKFDLDIIVFATGFDAMTGSILAIEICGRRGLSIKDAWREGPKTYLGLQVAGFPNFFTVTGPGSPSVLTNMPVAIEQHVEWITDCIHHMRENDFNSVEPTNLAVEKWVKHVNDSVNETLLPLANHSWYLGANIPGKTRVFMPYVGGMAKYRQRCLEVVESNYEGFVFSS